MKGCNYKRWNVKHIKEVHSLVVIAVNNLLEIDRICFVSTL